MTINKSDDAAVARAKTLEDFNERMNQIYRERNRDTFKSHDQSSLNNLNNNTSIGLSEKTLNESNDNSLSETAYSDAVEGGETSFQAGSSETPTEGGEADRNPVIGAELSEPSADTSEDLEQSRLSEEKIGSPLVASSPVEKKNNHPIDFLIKKVSMYFTDKELEKVKTILKRIVACGNFKISSDKRKVTFLYI